MRCDNCGNPEPYAQRIVYDPKEGKKEACNKCGVFSMPTFYDVCYQGKGAAEYNRNITDRMGNPIPLTSRSHKAKVLKARGHGEAGDLVHGAPYNPVEEGD